MTDHLETTARAWLRENVRSFVGKNSRVYQSEWISLRRHIGNFGQSLDMPAFTGVVVESNDPFSCVKTGINAFSLVDNAILPFPLVIGSKVEVTPYRRRRFDGSLLTDPVPMQGGLLVTVFGASSSPIPGVTASTETGAALLDMLHRLKCPDGIRVFSNFLVDLHATNIAFIEPVDDGQIVFEFDCTSGKFVGRIAIAFDPVTDLFCLEMRKLNTDGNEDVQHKCENIDLHSLAEVATVLLDDGQWKKAQVKVLKRAPRTEPEQEHDHA